MEYTIIVNDQSYELPKKTIAVMEKLDDVLKVDSTNLKVKQKFDKLHKFIKDLFGENAAKEMLGSDDLNEIDLSELTLTVKKVVDAYDKPVTDYDADKTARTLDLLPIEKIISMTKAMDKMSAMPPAKRR